MASTSARRPGKPNAIKTLTMSGLRIGAAASITFASGHIVFVMILGHPMGEVLVHISMAMAVIPMHSVIVKAWG